MTSGKEAVPDALTMVLGAVVEAKAKRPVDLAALRARVAALQDWLAARVRGDLRAREGAESLIRLSRRLRPALDRLEAGDVAGAEGILLRALNRFAEAEERGGKR